MIRAAVYGAAGYGGAELLRLLLLHPDLEVRQATSRDPGRAVDQVHPGLRGLTDLVLEPSDPEVLAPELDAIFLALPHGESAAVVPRILARCPGARVYDLAQDFRTGHEAEGWVYGFPELNRDALGEATRVACPGCFATAILLATVPAIACGDVPLRVIVDAKTGSSGSGSTPSTGTHHPARAATHRAYKVFGHQHETEIAAVWERLTAGNAPPLSLVPQSTPLVRGIYACCYVIHAAPPTDPAAWYRRFYAPSPFVRLVEEPPNVLNVRGTNNADLYVRQDGPVTLVIAAIDNLVRGAAGQAVQCLNLGFGMPEDRGLRLPALVP